MTGVVGSFEQVVANACDSHNHGMAWRAPGQGTLRSAHLTRESLGAGNFFRRRRQSPRLPAVRPWHLVVQWRAKGWAMAGSSFPDAPLFASFLPPSGPRCCDLCRSGLAQAASRQRAPSVAAGGTIRRCHWLSLSNTPFSHPFAFDVERDPSL